MKKLLVIIDMQKDFVTGPLGNDECKNIIPDILTKISDMDNGTDIVATLDTHQENYLKTQEGINLPVKHCIENTEGWKLIPELQNVKFVKTFTKNTFGSIELADWIKENNYTDVELIGVCTGICVISNAITIKAVNPEIKITVDSRCCACVTPESHKNALETMKMCQINVI